jgi:hypothetical protein
MGLHAMMRERRRALRRSPHPTEAVSRVRVRAGRELAVINVSSTGALVEGDARLLPGRQFEVHVVTADGRTLVRSRVMRAWVEQLWSDRVLYRAALSFEHPLELAPVVNEPSVNAPAGFTGNAVPGMNGAPSDAPGIAYPEPAT